MRQSNINLYLFSNHEQVVDDVLRPPSKLCPQDGVLGGDADGASVEVTLAHHGATEHDERGGGEAELVRAQDGRHDDVEPGPDLAVGLEDHPRAEVVHGQDLRAENEEEREGGRREREVRRQKTTMR